MQEKQKRTKEYPPPEAVGIKSSLVAPASVALFQSGKKEKLCFDTNKLIISLITYAIILLENPYRENDSFNTHSIINLL